VFRSDREQPPPTIDVRATLRAVRATADDHRGLTDEQGETRMLVAADYPFLDIFWSMLIFFCWVIWIWMVIGIFADIFSRRDISGWSKAFWCVFIIVLPFLGVLIYLIANSDGMAERKMGQVKAQQAEFDDYVQNVAASAGPAGEIDKAKKLLDSGAITQAEFDALKAKALA
jgi:hypothetical protein